MVSLRVAPPTTQTAQRRATIPLTALRTSAISSGDWIRLSTPAESVIAQAWPSLTLGEDEIVLSRVHALALGAPERVEVEKCGDVRWMTAKVVMIRVLEGGKGGGEREVAWELALLKEVLRMSCLSSQEVSTLTRSRRGPPIHLYRVHSHSPHSDVAHIHHHLRHPVQSRRLHVPRDGTKDGKSRRRDTGGDRGEVGAAACQRGARGVCGARQDRGSVRPGRTGASERHGGNHGSREITRPNG